ncbi:uncharacterized protein LOC110699396 [Chenopodium quinoa]|uniref:uncharacterized protein LOC110699396 n=1 Tax=Chenopodium quinoa TaxID=63459 RepID=UPI000B798115|nr:uncharacterized protein LOC110699396 [Chenopodium quinoa]
MVSTDSTATSGEIFNPPSWKPITGDSNKEKYKYEKGESSSKRKCDNNVIISHSKVVVIESDTSDKVFNLELQSQEHKHRMKTDVNDTDKNSDTDDDVIDDDNTGKSHNNNDEDDEDDDDDDDDDNSNFRSDCNYDNCNSKK